MQRCYGCMKEFGREYEVCPHCGYAVNTLPVIKSHLAPGVVLGQRYVLGKVLGYGGFGITYIAWDKNLDRAVAVKEFFPNAFSARSEGELTVSCYDSKATEQYNKGIEKMLDEAKRLSKFAKNKNIVDIHDFFKENNTAYIVMEYLEGKDFKKYLEEREGRISPEEAVDIILPVINALKDMHSVNTIHRDISPDNIFICDNGEVKLLDFGSARLSVDDTAKSMSVIVKEGYAPPEQYASKSKQGTWTDVYAVCATLYRAITGERPVNGLEREITPLKKFSQFGIKGHDKLEKAIVKGLEPVAKDRIQTSEELEYLLTTAMAVPGITMPKKPPKKENNNTGKNKKLIAALCAVLAVVVIAAAAFGIVKWINRPTEGGGANDPQPPVGDDSGVCGEYVEWNYDEETGELVIFGSGDMYDYDETNQSPWFGNSFNKVVIEEGITSIGTSAFSNTQIGEVVIPASLERMGIDIEELTIDYSRGITASTDNEKSPFAKVDSFKVDSENENYSSEDGVLYNKDKTFLIRYPAGNSLRDYSVRDGVTTICSWAFLDAINIKEVEIPDSVTLIGDYAFGGTKVSFWNVSKYNKSYSNDESGTLFNLDKTIMYSYPSSRNGSSYTIPDDVTEINDSCFIGADNLKTIALSKTLVTIGERAFSGCTALESIEIPDSVISIGSFAFEGCEALENVTIGNGVETIDTRLFADLPILESVLLGTGVKTIRQGAFENCPLLQIVNVFDGIETIASRAFAGCTNLDFLMLPSTVTQIGEDFVNKETRIYSDSNKCYVKEYADQNDLIFKKAEKCGDFLYYDYDKKDGALSIFGIGDMYNYGNPAYVAGDAPPWVHSKVNFIHISEGITSIGSCAFGLYPNINVESITIPNGVISIGEYAFASASLKKIDIPNTVISIGKAAFSECGLERVELPESVSVISEELFLYSELKEFNIHSKITNIGKDAFAFCGLLEKITVDSGNHFYKSDENGILFEKRKSVLVRFPAGSSLTEYTVQDDVEEIKSGAFSSCANLKSVTVGKGITYIPENAFALSGINNITFRNKVFHIYDCAFLECENLKSIDSSNFESIGNRAFENCRAIERIDIPSTCLSMGDGVFGGWGKNQTIYVDIPRNDMPSEWSEEWLYGVSSGDVNVNYKKWSPFKQ